MGGDGFDRLREIAWTLTQVLLTPSVNMKMALLLYSTIAALLLLVLAIAALVVSRPKEGETTPAQTTPAQTTPARTTPSAQDGVYSATGARRVGRVTRGSLLAGCGVLLLAAWVTAGFTTSSTELCRGCHWPAAQHAKADRASDPHQSVDCVSCHEPGSVVGRYLTDVPSRVTHLVGASLGERDMAEYGQVTIRACARCHRTAQQRTVVDGARGLRMSHAEPLAASARCIDCHTLRAGIVSTHNAGMAPCLRCHDGRRAASKCLTCHQGETATAARVRADDLRKVQIRDVSCGGCHDQARDCDPCHGARMPHTSTFKRYAHARAASVDLWYNGGKACGRCHTADRNPCSKCHTAMLGTAHGKWMASGHKSATTKACNTCHQQFAYVATRDFCKDLCHSSSAVEASPR